MLKSVSLTHVQYTAGDALGKLLAFSSLIPIALIVAFLTALLIRRDLNTFFFFSGQLLNELANAVLKRIIREPRPPGSGLERSDFGMPSSHSQFMAFFAAYAILHLANYVRLASSNLWNKAAKITFSLSLLGTAIVVAYSRVYLKYHTVEQVIVGHNIGYVMAILWFLFMKRIRSKYYRLLLKSYILQWFLVRDYTDIPNILQIEYDYLAKQRKKE